MYVPWGKSPFDCVIDEVAEEAKQGRGRTSNQLLIYLAIFDGDVFRMGVEGRCSDWKETQKQPCLHLD